MKLSLSHDQIFTFQLIVGDNELFFDLLHMIERWIPRKLAARFRYKVDQEELATVILTEALYVIETSTIAESQFISLCYLKMEFRVCDEVDRLKCQKRGGDSDGSYFGENYEAVDTNPLNDPQLIVQFRDAWASFQSKLDPIQRKIVRLRLRGKSKKHISQVLGLHPSQITRKLQIIQETYFGDECKNGTLEQRTANSEQGTRNKEQGTRNKEQLVNIFEKFRFFSQDPSTFHASLN